MKTIELTGIISEADNSPMRTVQGHAQTCQIGGIMQRGERGRYGGADMRESDCVNLLLAASLNHPRGESLVKNVRRIRAMPLRSVIYPMPPDISDDERSNVVRRFLSGLSLKTDVLPCGEALETIIRDMRTGAFDAWVGAAKIEVSAKFDERDRSAMIVIQDMSDDRRNVALYFSRDGGAREVAIERSVIWNTAVFRRFAEALGPIET